MLNILALEDNLSELNYLCDAINNVLKECYMDGVKRLNGAYQKNWTT